MKSFLRVERTPQQAASRQDEQESKESASRRRSLMGSPKSAQAILIRERTTEPADQPDNHRSCESMMCRIG
jgi:hypothetical protein